MLYIRYTSRVMQNISRVNRVCDRRASAAFETRVAKKPNDDSSLPIDLAVQNGLDRTGLVYANFRHGKIGLF